MQHSLVIVAFMFVISAPRLSASLCSAGKLRAVVACNRFRQAPCFSNLIKEAGRLGAGNGEAGQLSCSFPGIVVRYIQYPEAASSDHLIRYKVV